MKKNRKILAIIMAIALIAAIAVPAALAAGEESGIVYIREYPGGMYNQSFDKDLYHNTQGYTETLIAPWLTAVPKDSVDGHGHLWTIVADEGAVAGTIVTIAVQTKGNNYVAYVLRIDGPGEWPFPHDVSLGRGYAFLSEAPPPPAPEVGSLIVTKAIDGLETIPENWTAMITVTGDGYTDAQEINADNYWTVEFEDLLRGDYTVSESDREAIVGYSFVKVNGEGEYSVLTGDPTQVTIKNFYDPDPDPDPDPEPEVGSLIVTKAIDGFDAIPAEWTATITVTGADFDEAQEINAENDWTVEFEGLVPGDYTVSESDKGIINGYYFVKATGEGEYSVPAGDATEVTITNFYDVTTTTPDPVYFNIIVEKHYSGHELPEDFYIIVEGPEGFEALQLDFSNEPMIENGVITWYINGLTIEGTYKATEYNYGVPGYSRTGATTDSATLSKETKVQGADFVATLKLVNNYSTGEDPGTSTRITTTVTRQDPDPTPEPEPEEVLNFEEIETPLAEFVPVEEVLAEEVILEEAVPLGEMPQTGINDMFALWLVALCAALFIAGALTIVVAKTNKKND